MGGVRGGSTQPQVERTDREQRQTRAVLHHGRQSLDETVHFKFIGGEPGAMTRSDILQHVVAHSTYHRGWIAEMFFQVPARNPTTDLPVYLRSLGPTAAGSS